MYCQVYFVIFYLYFNRLTMNSSFATKYSLVLDSKSQLGENGSCMLWTGHRSGGYGRIKVTFSPHIYKNIYVHRLSYFIDNNIHEYVLLDEDADQISHRCHHKLCINPSHLCKEPTNINGSRKSCQNNNTCFGHSHYPNCLFW